MIFGYHLERKKQKKAKKRQLAFYECPCYNELILLINDSRCERIDLMTINEMLKDVRVAKGWSLEDFSQQLRLPVQTIADWEKGTSYPSHSQLLKIAKITDIPADELLACDHDYSKKLSDDKRRLQWQGIIFTLMLMSGVILVGATLFAFLATSDILWVPGIIGIFLLADGSFLAKKYFDIK